MPNLDFLGKGDVAGHHLSVPFHTLEADEKKSVNGVNLDGNLIIHGDNLLALKALLPRYANKVKCIYIDPPYNTGNKDWVYNDKVNSPLLKDWYKKVVGAEDQDKHDKWLCMMYPRLQLLRELLSDDGVIFISIDDNEQANLKLLCDEIFGVDNFIDIFIVRSNPRGNQAKKHTASEHEYVVSFAKDKKNVKPYAFPKNEESFKKKDGDGKYREIGLRKRGAGSRREDAENEFYPIYYNPKSKQISTSTKEEGDIKIIPYLSSGKEGRWRWSKEKVEKDKEKLLVRLSKKRNGKKEYEVFEKEYFSEGRLTKAKSIIYEKWVNYENATEFLGCLFEGEKVFQYAKPMELIRYFIKATCPNGIVLDSFAGSGTTAHAVLDINKEDGCGRKFILVECEDYADKTTAERVRKVIKGIPKADDKYLREGLGGSFTYTTLGHEIDDKKILSGESMPAWADLSRHVYWLATGETLDKNPKENKEGFVGKYKGDSVYLLYKPDVKFMQSNKAVLTWDMAEKISKEKKGKGRIIYYAAAAYISQKDMYKFGIVFCQLPWAITKQLVKA